jgi:hypothetical protein
VPAALFTRAIAIFPGSTASVAGSTTIGGGVGLGVGVGVAVGSGVAVGVSVALGVGLSAGAADGAGGAGGLTCALTIEASTKIHPPANTANARRTIDTPE